MSAKLAGDHIALIAAAFLVLPLVGTLLLQCGCTPGAPSPARSDQTADREPSQTPIIRFDAVKDVIAKQPVFWEVTDQLQSSPGTVILRDTAHLLIRSTDKLPFEIKEIASSPGYVKVTEPKPGLAVGHELILTVARSRESQVSIGQLKIHTTHKGQSVLTVPVLLPSPGVKEQIKRERSS